MEETGKTMTALIALVLATFHMPVVVFAYVSDGYGACPAFYHSHETTPGVCYDNDDNILGHGPVLPVPTEAGWVGVKEI